MSRHVHSEDYRAVARVEATPSTPLIAPDEWRRSPPRSPEQAMAELGCEFGIEMKAAAPRHESGETVELLRAKNARLLTELRVFRAEMTGVFETMKEEGGRALGAAVDEVKAEREATEHVLRAELADARRRADEALRRAESAEDNVDARAAHENSELRARVQEQTGLLKELTAQTLALRARGEEDGASKGGLLRDAVEAAAELRATLGRQQRDAGELRQGLEMRARESLALSASVDALRSESDALRSELAAARAAGLGGLADETSALRAAMAQKARESQTLRDSLNQSRSASDRAREAHAREEIALRFALREARAKRFTGGAMPPSPPRARSAGGSPLGIGDAAHGELGASPGRALAIEAAASKRAVAIAATVTASANAVKAKLEAELAALETRYAADVGAARRRIQDECNAEVARRTAQATRDNAALALLSRQSRAVRLQLLAQVDDLTAQLASARIGSDRGAGDARVAALSRQLRDADAANRAQAEANARAAANFSAQLATALAEQRAAIKATLPSHVAGTLASALAEQRETMTAEYNRAAIAAAGPGSSHAALAVSNAQKYAVAQKELDDADAVIGAQHGRIAALESELASARAQIASSGGEMRRLRAAAAAAATVELRGSSTSARGGDEVYNIHDGAESSDDDGA